MAEDVTTSLSARQHTPPNGTTRRILTDQESAQFRRPGRFAGLVHDHALASNGSPSVPRRRSSNISLESFNEARHSIQNSTDDILRPRPRDAVGDDEDTSSKWHSAPLAFALLPAVGGMMFKNGGAVVSDVLLLGLAAVFLNWSVRLPWFVSPSPHPSRGACAHDTFANNVVRNRDWYRSAQELRTNEEYDGNTVLDTDSDNDAASSPRADELPKPRPAAHDRQTRIFDAAVRELYIHELLALLCCFLSPALAAYLLHSIRASLSRPSEGLVSNYNLTIFLLAAELRPMSHLIKLGRARTLHLQRVVKDNPYSSVDERQNVDIRAIRSRLETLEEAPEKAEPQASARQTAAVAAEVRRAVQPELDALNRAVRRYEKRAATQTMQTEARMADLEARLADAVSLAAAAARGGRRGLGTLVGEWVELVVRMPFWALAALGRAPGRVGRWVWVVGGWVVGGGKTRVEGKSWDRSGRERERAQMRGGKR